MKYRIHLTALVCIVMAGCSQSADNTAMKSEPSGNSPITELNDSQQKQRDVAIAAKEKLFQALVGELTASMETNGVPKSIEICKTKAPELAESTGKEFGLRIGRTSFKLRNSKSAPPDWAASFVDIQVEEEVDVALDNGQLGVLLPIRLNEACIKCHGSADTIAADVASAIKANYPDDNATGFAEGDLRGYFWIEVPGSKE